MIKMLTFACMPNFTPSHTARFRIFTITDGKKNYFLRVSAVVMLMYQLLLRRSFLIKFSLSVHVLLLYA